MARRRKARGPRGYTDGVKREAMQLWASGTCKSDREIAKKLGVKRIDTIRDWRRKGVPEDWEEFRRRADAKATEKAEQKIGDTLGEVIGRQLKHVRTAQRRLVRDMKSAKAGTADRTAASLVKLHEEERQLMGAPGQTQEVLVNELSDDDRRNRIRERLRILRRAGIAGRGGSDGSGAEEESGKR